MSGLKMPDKGKAALLLSDLNAEHAPPPASVEAENADVTCNVGYNVTTLHVTNVTTLQRYNREERLQQGLQIAQQDKVSVVTVRVSARLNEYMDRYVERVNRANPQQRYRKQDAIAEAFAAFFADHPMPPAPPDEELI
jgi:hypothetical protein